MLRSGRSAVHTPLAPVAFGPVHAPTAPNPVRAGRHYRELDAYRGMAALCIVVFHVYQFCNVYHYLYLGTPAFVVLSSLDVGVPAFFVLSAFLVSLPIVRSLVDGRRATPFRELLLSRAVRLLPVYYMAVLAVWFVRQARLPGDWRDLVEHLTFTQVFDGRRIFYTIGPAWSVSVAAFCYLLFPILGLVTALVFRRLTTRRGRVLFLAAGLTATGAVSVLWKAWSVYVRHRPTTGSFTTWFGPVAYLDVVVIGIAVALIAACAGDARRLSNGGRLALRLLGVAIIGTMFLVRKADTWSDAYFPDICAVGFGCIVAAAILGARTDRWSRTVGRQPLIWLGALSYSIYLWHEPVMLVLRDRTGLVRAAPEAFVQDAVVVLLVSVLIGWVSYSLIERPSGQLQALFRRDMAADIAVRGAEERQPVRTPAPSVKR